MENREMYDEINALIGAVAKAFDVSETEVITAIEQGRLGMEMSVDDEGVNYIAAGLDGRVAHIYPGAVFRPDDDGADKSDEDCGGGGCTCGH